MYTKEYQKRRRLLVSTTAIDVLSQILLQRNTKHWLLVLLHLLSLTVKSLFIFIFGSHCLLVCLSFLLLKEQIHVNNCKTKYAQFFSTHTLKQFFSQSGFRKYGEANARTKYKAGYGNQCYGVNSQSVISEYKTPRIIVNMNLQKIFIL